MEHTEVRDKEFSEAIKDSGAVGVAELIKLDGLRMSEFHSVLFVDCDVVSVPLYSSIYHVEQDESHQDAPFSDISQAI